MARYDRQAIGRQTEQLALDYLGHRGLRLLERNFRCRYGEIDLIMLDNIVVVFVEVRFRQCGRFASAAASIDGRKQRKLCQTAGYFLARYPQFHASPVRFDVVAFDGPSQQEFTLQWLPDAFRPNYRES
jgi:putative endonuclease